VRAWLTFSLSCSDNLQYWLWGCWCGDILGGLFGATLYDSLIFTGAESPMNRRWGLADLNPVRWPGKLKSKLVATKNDSISGLKQTLRIHKEEDREAAVVEKV